MRSSKKTGGRGFILPTLLCLQSGRRERVCPEQGRGATIPYLPPTIPFVFILLRALLRSFAFFCTNQKLNSFLFNRFRTLWQKHPGEGYRLPRARFARGPLPSSVIFPASPLRGTARRHVCSYLYV